MTCLFSSFSEILIINYNTLLIHALHFYKHVHIVLVNGGHGY